jgi:hypothetical protein
MHIILKWMQMHEHHIMKTNAWTIDNDHKCMNNNEIWIFTYMNAIMKQERTFMHDLIIN